MSGGASRTVCPHLAPWRGGPLMWLHLECCCSFLPATKATCFYFLRLGPCYLELWRNRVRYVTYEMNGMNANQRKASQRGVCQLGTLPIVLLFARLCIYIQMILGWEKLSSYSFCLCLYKSTAHIFTHSSVNHTHSIYSRFQLFHSCHQCLSLSTPSLTVKRFFKQGSSQVLSHSFKYKWTSKSPRY